MSLTNLDVIRRKFGVPDSMAGQLENWLSNIPFNRRDYILPEYLADDIIEIDYDTARKLMYIAVKAGILITNYELHCPKCGERVETVHSQLDIPTKLVCDNDGYSFNPWLNQEFIIVSFRISNNKGVN